MVSAAEAGDAITVATSHYRLSLAPGEPHARLEDVDGVRRADLLLAGSLNTLGALDDTASLEKPVRQRDGDATLITVAARSSAWRERRLVMRCEEDALAVRLEVAGRGDLTDAWLLAGFVSAWPQRGSGFHASGASFATVFSSEPSSPERVVAPASEPAAIDVVGTSLPGRGHWFFTPPPLLYVFSPSPPGDLTDIPDGPWLSLGIDAPVEELTFTGLHYEPGEHAFGVRLAYEGGTRVDGRFSTPWLVLAFGAADPYDAIARHAERLRARGLAPALPAAGGGAPPHPAWWREPIFCGWGAQCHLAWRTGWPAPGAPSPTAECTQANYDAFLAVLAERGIVPGTIVIDDRWERVYGSGEPDRERWPDLPGWIARRHAEGKRVLVWWKTWATDALDSALCVRNAAGVAVAADPTHPGYREALRAALRRALALPPIGCDADGLKVDFTAMTPSGPGMRRHGGEWGIALLHRLMALIYSEAKAIKPDALVIAHGVDPRFADVLDMVRLNDVQRLSDLSPPASLVPHMIHRARIAASALPGVPIDTDDWAFPDRASWRQYLAVKPELGVPSLYYATHIDCSAEPLTDDDYAAIRDAWGRYRSRLAEERSASEPDAKDRVSAR
jgi:hypothetical protein